MHSGKKIGVGVSGSIAAYKSALLIRLLAKAGALVKDVLSEEAEHIFHLLQKHFTRNNKLQGKQVLITAGPTCEAIDPVRYISNHSTGKMGYALAEAMAQSGAQVKLISGPAS